jgi:lipopolysaccharide transport system ATP-binding protein
VAAHLESEILIVDEVLAVGDAEFQKKCLGKMGEVSKGEGRTVLFVSHNMGSVVQLCKKGLLLSNGKSSNFADIKSIIHDYLHQNKNTSRLNLVLNNQRIANVLSVVLKNNKNSETSEISVLESWKICIDFQINEQLKGLVCAIGIVSLGGIPLKTTWHKPIDLGIGNYKAEFIEENTQYALGTYIVHVGLSQNKQNIQFIEDAIQFEIVIGNKHLDIHKLDYSSATGIIIDQMKSSITKYD